MPEKQKIGAKIVVDLLFIDSKENKKKYLVPIIGLRNISPKDTLFDK